MKEALAKLARLDARLGELDGLLVAYSGGVDSGYLAWRARRVLGGGMRAILADSPSLSRRHLREALRFAAAHGIPVEVVATRELENPAYARNDGLRCFYCKDTLFSAMKECVERGAGLFPGLRLAYGMNADDQGDYRPGRRAAEEHGVVAPLAEAGLTKAEIRLLARDAGLELWDKPAAPCLSSRVAYGQPIDAALLGRIEAAEDLLWDLGFRQFRVRHHGEIARIEIARDELGKALSLPVFDVLAARVRELGFRYVAVDCAGFSSGNLNQALSKSTLSA